MEYMVPSQIWQWQCTVIPYVLPGNGIPSTRSKLLNNLPWVGEIPTLDLNKTSFNIKNDKETLDLRCYDCSRWDQGQTIFAEQSTIPSSAILESFSDMLTEGSADVSLHLLLFNSALECEVVWLRDSINLIIFNQFCHHQENYPLCHFIIIPVVQIPILIAWGFDWYDLWTMNRCPCQPSLIK